MPDRFTLMIPILAISLLSAMAYGENESYEQFKTINMELPQFFRTGGQYWLASVPGAGLDYCCMLQGEDLSNFESLRSFFQTATTKCSNSRIDFTGRPILLSPKDLEDLVYLAELAIIPSHNYHPMQRSVEALTCQRDKKTGDVLLSWIDGLHNELLVVFVNGNVIYHPSLSALEVRGEFSREPVSRSALDKRFLNVLRLSDHDLGGECRDGSCWFVLSQIPNHVPVSVNTIYLHNDGLIETFPIPFSDGLAPGWRRWSQEGQLVGSSGLTLELGQPEVLVDNEILQKRTAPQDARFTQQMHSSGEIGSAGIFRDFVALQDDMNYRIELTGNLREADQPSSPWVATVHAAFCSSGGLSQRLMIGEDPLPGGEMGGSVKTIHTFSGGTPGTPLMADGKSEEVSASQTMYLPPGYDAIRVWIAYEASGPSSGIELKSLSLEPSKGKIQGDK